jgi:hypothetical protein
MSGPMAASFGLEAAVLISAQSILQGAAEIAAGISAAEQQAAVTRQQRREERQRMRAAQQAGIEKRQREEAESTALATLTRQREAALALLATTQDGDFAATLQSLLAAGVSAQEQLTTFLARARLAGASADVAIARQQLIERVLDRLDLDPGAPLPAALDTLAQQIAQAPTTERAEALATELRYQVQTHNAARAAAALEKSALAARQQLEEAAAVVLEQSLKDLGYAVEEIEETLFVEGGVAHFQRPEWGDYFIRLRIDPKRQAMNFNVVRAGRTGVAGEDLRHEDMRAEERWCSAFPRLFETLKARGIPINVTRLLQAGEAPVQVVDASSLPARRGAEERQRETLKARSIS